ncbi:MAG: glutamate--tRNA ligase, partial [Alphaproteobacteria bacterium]|nr:glutamate--tRNA ligase [Alphaproteobacteria bacterium]
AHKLVELGGAHYCFCSADEADEQKDEQTNTKFVDPCKNLTLEEARKRIANGEPYVIRQTVHKKGTSVFHDVVYGDIEIDYDELDEGVLLKSDGFPTYNFANVVDDHLMEITHVVRGNEYISSTPKYNLIYEDFGWQAPVYVHVPPVMKDAQHKLSKRNGDASFQDLVAKGYLPEAILNYIALLGWNPGTEQEIFSLAELKQLFTAERLNKSPSIFDIAKLTWMNGCYIRNLSPADFHALAMPYYEKCITRKVNLEFLSSVLQKRVETLAEICPQTDFLETMPEYDVLLYQNKKMKTDEQIAKNSLVLALPVLEKVDVWTNENLFEVLKALAENNGLKNGQVLYPVRIALSGKETTPGGATELAVILGKDETINRIKQAIDKL